MKSCLPSCRHATIARHVCRFARSSLFRGLVRGESDASCDFFRFRLTFLAVTTAWRRFSSLGGHWPAYVTPPISTRRARVELPREREKLCRPVLLNGLTRQRAMALSNHLKAAATPSSISLLFNARDLTDCVKDKRSNTNLLRATTGEKPRTI